MGAHQFLRIGATAALLCLLSACWLSDKPLLTAKTASEVDFTGTYRGVGEEDRSDLVIASRGKRAYELHQGQDKVATRYLRLKDEWYLAQYEGRDEDADADADQGKGEVVYLYQPLRAVGGRLYLYSADCDDTPGDYRGMERKSGACTFTSLDGLIAAARAYVARVEKGEVSGQPAVWTKVSVSRH